MANTADTYEYTKNLPTYGYRDDVQILMDLCHALDFGIYRYGGMVMQIESGRYTISSNRWFVSFIELNNGRQIFYEASGNGRVFNSKHHPQAFEHFLSLLQENVDKWKEI